MYSQGATPTRVSEVSVIREVNADRSECASGVVVGTASLRYANAFGWVVGKHELQSNSRRMVCEGPTGLAQLKTDRRQSMTRLGSCRVRLNERDYG